MKQNITKHLSIRMAVYELLTALHALELAVALPEEEILKHVCSTLYQFKVFKHMKCFMSSHRCHLDKEGTLFCNSSMQR